MTILGVVLLTAITLVRSIAALIMIVALLHVGVAGSIGTGQLRTRLIKLIGIYGYLFHVS